MAGSTKLGKHVILAGQVGLAGHLRIGDNVTIAAQSGVMRDIRDDEKWFGTPAQPDRSMKRQLLALQKLPELLRRFNRFEKFVKTRMPQEAVSRAKNTAEKPPPATDPEDESGPEKAD